MRLTRLRLSEERGAAMLEAALITPLILLIMVGIFEVGRAYQTWQVLTNAAREGARAAVVPNSNKDTVKAIVKQYMADGQLGATDDAKVVVDQAVAMAVNGTTVGATQVSVEYPFKFFVLQPVARLVSPGTKTGEPITMKAASLMRNETQ